MSIHCWHGLAHQSSFSNRNMILYAYTLANPSTMSYRHQRTAQRLLATHGKAGFLVRTMPEPDGAGGVVEGVEEHYTVQIAEGGYDVALRGENPTIDDLLGIMAVNANITPRRGDVLKLHDDAYTLVDVKPIAPGEPEIVFTFRARR